MNIALTLLLCPLLILLCSWIVKPASQMTRVVTLLLWVHLVIAVTALLPILAGSVSTVHLSRDFSFDRIGALFILLAQIVVVASMSHAHVYFRNEAASPEHSQQLQIFYTCTVLFWLAMTSVFCCQSLGFLWISIEATTLCSAPLVFFHRNKHALEAGWKYLMICSVGIAFVLLGIMFIFASSQYGAVAGGSINIPTLVQHASQLQFPLLRLGFLFCLLGLGTKAGVFPLHHWLPDAYSEAPAPASAMLSGGLLNCALYALYRISQIVAASGHELFVRNALLWLGAITIVAASLLLVKQHGLKRLFAYSSIENAGLMLVAIGLNSAPLFLLLAINHSVAKVALFLLCGNIIQSSGSSEMRDIRGLVISNPLSSVLLVLCTLAVTGAPPFGAFSAEWMMLTKLGQSHLWLMLSACVCALTLSFLAIFMHVGKMLVGMPRLTEEVALSGRSEMQTIPANLVPAALLLITVLSGLTALPRFIW